MSDTDRAHKVGQQFTNCEIANQTINNGVDGYEEYIQNVTMKCTDSQKRTLRAQARAEGMDQSRWMREAYKIRIRYAGYQSKLLAHEEVIKKLLDAMSDAHIPESVFRSER
jgi:hypothetical protein